MSRVLRALVVTIALVVVALSALAWQGEHRAHGRFEGDLSWQQPWADGVAAWALGSAGSRSRSGAGELFDHEWTLVSCQMAVLGLGQLTLEHPGLGDRYLPAIRSCTDWLITPAARAFGTSKWGEDLLGDAPVRGTHAYAGYLLTALSMHRRLEPDVPWADEHTRLLDRLEHGLQRPIDTVYTYPGEAYPADIASVLAGLALGGRDVRDAAERLDAVARDPGSGLYRQYLPGGPPRGSGTAITSYFMGHAHPELSKTLHQALQHERAIIGLWGVREYPHGVSGWGDVDSGPVILGLGMSTTGFALGPARMHGDRTRYVRLHRTAGVAGLPITGPSGRWYWFGGSIGNAILLAMSTAPRLE